MFNVIKIKSKDKIKVVEVNEYVEKNKIPYSIEYVVRNKIRERREALGLTQNNLAEMLNITRQSFSLYESGKQVPSILMCYLISKVLNADAQELFYFEEIEEDCNEK